MRVSSRDRRRSFRRRESRVLVVGLLGALATVSGCSSSGEARQSAAGADATLDLGSEQLDPAVLDMHAPVSGESIRNGRRVSEALGRAQWARQSECLQRAGFPSLPEFRPDRARWRYFPDVKELESVGFGQTVPAAENGENDEPSSPTGADYQAALQACCDSALPSKQAREAALRVDDWWAIVDEAVERPEEKALWEQASDCLADRGYDRESLRDEPRFAASVTGLVMSLEDLDERLDRELEIAGDYVECAGDVWKAREAWLRGERESWLDTHREDLIELQHELDSFIAESPS